MRHFPSRLPPRGVWVSAAFFALSGVLELGLGVWEAPPRPRFWLLWEALGRAVLYWLVALGLWNRLALCRSIAMVYCLAVLVTYAAVLAMALAQAPVTFHASVIIQSLWQVPSCALLLPYLRSPRAGQLFPRPLIRS